jgi:uncharacterized membrane protein
MNKKSNDIVLRHLESIHTSLGVVYDELKSLNHRMKAIEKELELSKGIFKESELDKDSYIKGIIESNKRNLTVK